MNLPASFIAATQALLGADQYAQLEQALATPPLVSLRLHPIKWQAHTLAFTAEIGGAVPWATQGYYVESRPTFTFDPLFHGGAYYVQEA